MFFGIITLLTALSMATVAAVFAIYGIVAIFAGMPQFALVMGAVIELGKVMGVSWLYRNWSEPTKIKYFMTPIVLVAMLLTSMGIFGLLSKAHLEQTSPVANNQVQIERLERQIQQENSRIADSESVIAQLDQSVQVLINFDRIRGPDGALAVRESQSEQRELLRQTIEESVSEINRLEDQRLELVQAVRAIELEVGPIKYIAELIYGDGQDRTEEAVRWVIIAFIFVFDPMAILLLMAANYTLANRKKKSENNDETDEEKVEGPTNVPVQMENNTPEIVEKHDTIEQTVNEHILDSNNSEQDISIRENINEPEVEYDDFEESNIEETTNEESEHSDVIQQQSSDNIFTRKKSDPRNIETKDVTPVHDLGNGYVEYENHMYQQNALKELLPHLFETKNNQRFGKQFPKVAKKADTFVRTDVIPYKVFKFDGKKWNEVNKDQPDTYLYDQEYIKFLISSIDNGEYDIDLLSNDEKNQIEEYLQTVVKNNIGK